MGVLSPKLYNTLHLFVQEKFGLNFPLERQNDLERELTNACFALGIKDLVAFVDLISTQELKRHQLEIIANSLTIGETYFLREKKVFEILEQNVLISLIESKKGRSKSLTIWSAGCSTGEEVYSIAMILNSLAPLLKGWKIKVIGTDLNTESLKKAEKGIYGQWSFRTSSSFVKEKYFTKTAQNSYQVSDRLRKNVSFQFFNLANESSFSQFAPGSVDIIFCRNVLMYFAEETRKKIIQKFKGVLSDDGWLILSLSEISSTLNKHFKMVNFPHAILYKKENGYQPDKASSAVLPVPLIEPMINSINYQGVELNRAKAQGKSKKYIAPEIQIERAEKNILIKAEEIFDSGKFTGVISLLEKELPNSKNYFLTLEVEQLHLMLAKSYANLGKLDEAKKWCKEAITGNKINHGSYYLLANILMEQGSQEEVISALRSALFIEPDFILALFMLGNVMHKQGKVMEARKQFDTTLKILSRYLGSELVPDSDGLTVSHLREIIQSITKNYNNG